MCAGDYISMTVYGCNCVNVTLCVVCAHVTVCVCPCDPVCDRKSVFVCVYPGLAIPSSPSLLEGRREMANVGEGASPLEVGEEMPAETASGNRGSIPSPGSCWDLPLYTQMSRAGLGDRAAEPPCGGQGRDCPGRGPASPGSAHLAGQAGEAAAPARRADKGPACRRRGPGTRRVRNQPLIKGPELMAGDTRRQTVVAPMTNSGEMGGATPTPRHTNTHWQRRARTHT